MSDLTDMTLKMQHALTHECRMSWARKVIEERHKRGEWKEIAYLDSVTREVLARKLCEEVK